MSGITYVFVLHGGEIEVKAALLAASLHHNLAGRYELIGAVPGPVERWGGISRQTARLLARFGVRTVTIRNEIDENYPIGNKISALGVPAKHERVIFLDSDILLLQPFFDHRDLATGYAAKPADADTFIRSGGRWGPVYDLFDLPRPDHRVHASHSRERMMPYYNAGVICCRDNQRLYSIWLDVCRKIDAVEAIKPKRPWLDQIGLPIACALANVCLHELSEEMNFPAHKRALDESPLPYFCHYHTPERIMGSARLSRTVGNLIDHHPELLQVMRLYAGWRELIQSISRS